MVVTKSFCPGGSWVIKPGDTLWKIALANNTTVAVLMSLNPGINPYNLSIGQTICLPEQEPSETVPPCESGLYWTVSPGDTFYSISQETGVPVATLLKLNPQADPKNLQIGANLCLPGK